MWFQVSSSKDYFILFFSGQYEWFLHEKIWQDGKIPKKKKSHTGLEWRDPNKESFLFGGNYPFKFVHITTCIPKPFLWMNYEFLVVHMIYSVLSLENLFSPLWLCFLVGVLQNFLGENIPQIILSSPFIQMRFWHLWLTWDQVRWLMDMFVL